VVDILSTFCDVFLLVLSKFPTFGFLLFDCFVYRQNVTCLKRFTRYGHNTGDVEDRLIIARLAVVERLAAVW